MGGERGSTEADIAVVVSRLDRMHEDLMDWQRESREHREALRAEIESMQREMARYKGLLGGIALVFSGIVTALMIAKGWIIGHTTGGMR